MQNALNVLLLEDSEDDAELICLELHRGGLNPLINRVDTEDGFVRILQENQFDLILSDYNLPNFNAPKALEIYKNYQIDLPFIILSGAVEAEDVVTLLKAGAHDFLEKNDLARLVPAIERELREVSFRSQKKKSEQTLKKLFRAIEQSPLSMMLTDEKGRVEYVNPTFEHNSGEKLDDVIGQLPDVLDGDFVSLEKNAEIWEAIHQKQEWRGEFSNQKKTTGEGYWEYISIAPILDEEGNLTNLSISREDITYRKDTEERLYRVAHFDKLTGLPHRQLLMDNLKKAILQYEKLALFVLDFNEFNNIFETLGHDVGDKIILKAAQRIEEKLSIHNVFGRLSGSKFAIMHVLSNENLGLESLVQSIITAFEQPIWSDTREIFVSMNIGIALYPQDGLTPEIMLKNAEAALNESRKQGQNQFCFFSQNMTRKALDRLSQEGFLRKALSKKEFVLHYQPIIDAKTSLVCGAEALIRWNHPENGLLGPDHFIPLAEESTLIVSIGRWVMDQAIKDLKIIQSQINSPFCMAINISAVQIWSSPLLQDLEKAIAEHEIDPTSLQIEMTENVCLHDEQATLKTLNGIAKTGVKIAVDDFGTGYSSLSYLKRYPFSALKIDKSFVNGLPHDLDDVVLIDAMMAIAERLGLKVVAEGVEDSLQFEFLQEHKCDLIQGYYFSKPLEKTQFIDFLLSSYAKT